MIWALIVFFSNPDVREIFKRMSVQQKISEERLRQAIRDMDNRIGE